MLMKESFLDRAKADGKVFVNTVSVLTRLSKLKLEIVTTQKERKRVLGVIGGTIVDIYNRSNAVDAQVIRDAVSEHFDSLRRLDAELLKLAADVQEAKASFKMAGTNQTKADSQAGGN
jgi:hypothetical protein